MSLAIRLAQALRPAHPAGARCGSCRHLRDDAFELERALPGYAVLGSALGTVRAGDGLCELHQRCVSAHSGCDRFVSRAASC